MSVFKKRLIILDDDQISVLITKKLIISSKLIPNDVEVISFLSPIECIKFIEESCLSSSITVLLLDINMPEMSGFEVLNRLKLASISKHFYVMMLTSSFSSYDRDIASQYSLVVDYFNKPLDLNSIVKIIEYFPNWDYTLDKPPWFILNHWNDEFESRGFKYWGMVPLNMG